MEAFSDGVIAIAITLLTLDIHVPSHDVRDQGLLAHELLQLWPHYLAFVTSFIVVGIIWINHHAIFEHIGQADYYLVLINVFLLLGIALLPFTTALVAEYVNHDGKRTAMMVYTGWFFLVAIAFNLLWWYPRHFNLIKPDADQAAVDRITQRFRLGPPSYGLIFIVSIFSPIAALVGTGVLALIYALPNQSKVRETAIRP